MTATDKPESAKEEDIWQDDKLGRREEADFLIKHLLALEEHGAQERKSLVMNVKGRWGLGKTYFLDNLTKQLKHDKHKVVHLNAWQADEKVDPLISLIAAIKNELKDDLKIKALAILFGNLKNAISPILGKIAMESAKNFVEKRSGIDTEKVKEDVKDATLPINSIIANEIETASKRREAIVKFTECLEGIIDYYKNTDGPDHPKLPLFIIIDELDRCRPTFAIELLERINHLFDVKGIVFLIGTDSDELSHSVRAVYGEGFNAHGYLNRFFGATYHLAEPKVDQWIEYLLDRYDIDIDKYITPEGIDKKEIIQTICQGFQLSIRDYHHIFFMLKSSQTGWTHKCKIDLITMLSYAILLFTKQDDYLGKIKFYKHNNSDHTYEKTTKIVLPIESGTDQKASLHTYLREINRYSHKSLTDCSNQFEAQTTTTPLDIHIYSLIKDQKSKTAPTEHANEEVLTSDYLKLLKTVSSFKITTFEPEPPSEKGREFFVI